MFPFSTRESALKITPQSELKFLIGELFAQEHDRSLAGTLRRLQAVS